jgi:hypothetical protein
MYAIWGLCLLAGLYPFFRAWRANRETTLRPALAWAGCAWAAWVGQAAAATWGDGADLASCLAMCLLACAGVAVLGARRPGEGAWSLFVAGGLLAVLLVGLGRTLLLRGADPLRPDPLHLVLLTVLLAVPLGNYLPTRLGLAALAVGAACAVELARLSGAEVGPLVGWGGRWLLAAAPWLGLFAGRRGAAAESEIDALWRGFRDRFGLVWAERLREQFNRAAENASWRAQLGWRGLYSEGLPPEAAAVALRAAMKRFRRGKASEDPC